MKAALQNNHFAQNIILEHPSSDCVFFLFTHLFLYIAIHSCTDAISLKKI